MPARPFGDLASLPPDLRRLGDEPRLLAKRMLRELVAGHREVARHFEALHPRYAQIRARPTLADAQLVVARMLGYRSWPRLAHHHKRMARCRDEIERGAPPPDGERSTAHIRCGRDIEEGLRRAGYVGSFIELSDPYCQGPVLPQDPRLQVEPRADFLAEAYALDRRKLGSQLRAQWEALADLERFERVVLWFEHDSYDQLILAAVLSTLPASPRPRVELVCIDAYPGHPRFRGLGELSEVSLRGLWDDRRAVTASDRALGAAAWSALQRSEPGPLFELARSGTPAIPPMAGALRRHLMELPGRHDGLSLTQRLTLAAVRAGAARVDAAFRSLLRSDPLPYLGDTMFWWEARELAAGGALTITPTDDAWPSWGLALTELGETLLQARADWVAEAGRMRWVGGIPCGPGHPPWRWDASRGRPCLSDQR